jgi:signal peptidase II
MRAAVPWITAVLIIVADRFSKMMIVKNIELGGWRDVLPGFALTHVHNRGIAFSMFSDGGWLSRVILHGIILTAVVLIAWMLFQHGHRQRLAGLGFGLILGGAIGNLIDRVLYGWVVDFLHVWITVSGKMWSWPDFNVADSAITVGACLLILNEILTQRRDRAHAPDAD